MALTLWPESRAFRGEPRPQQSELKNTQEPRGNAEMTWGKRRGEAGICRAELQREEYPHLLMLSRMVAAPQAPYEQPRLLPTRPNPAMLKKNSLKKWAGEPALRPSKISLLPLLACGMTPTQAAESLITPEVENIEAADSIAPTLERRDKLDYDPQRPSLVPELFEPYRAWRNELH
jgi:hypothetical protein